MRSIRRSLGLALLLLGLFAFGTAALAEAVLPEASLPEASLPEASLPEDYPLTDEAGFLTGGEYVHEDPEQGRWIYLSETLRVEIHRRRDEAVPLEWFETEVHTKPGEHLYTPHNEPKQRKDRPQTWAVRNQSVLVITDDNYSYQLRKGIKTGIIIRDGVVISDQAKKKNGSGWPKEEVLAYFPDGRMKTFDVQEHTAQEYLDMGATEVFSFGPILLQDGIPGEKALDPKYYHQREPRCAIGMIEPNHYLILTVKGRVKDSKGVYLNWLVEKMQEHGVQEALNLDGGGTVALVFMGKLLNYKQNNNRSVNSVIAFGHSALVTGE